MQLDKELEARIASELGTLGYEVVMIETFSSGRRKVIKIFIDRADGGVTIDDCVRATRAVSLVLDGVEAIPGPYNLEISSPGFARPLTKRTHFERFRGERSRIEHVDEGKGKITDVGAITDVSETAVTLSVGGTERIIPFERILRANLSPEERGIPGAGSPKKGKRAGKRL